MSVNQKQGVYDAVVAFCEENDIHFEDGMKLELTKEQRSTVVEMVTQALIAGEIDFSDVAREKHDTEQKKRTYCNGLVSNWLRKDKRLNGNTTYEIKNPGSRAGQGDEQLKNLKLLYKTIDDEDQKATVQEAIDKRVEELKTEKLGKVEIDYNAIPESLKEALGIKQDEVVEETTDEEQYTE
jgi:hypothetical protein